VGNAEILNHGIEVRYLRLPIWIETRFPPIYEQYLEVEYHVTVAFNSVTFNIYGWGGGGIIVEIKPTH
jgi:hypothetical protein